MAAENKNQEGELRLEDTEFTKFDENIINQLFPIKFDILEYIPAESPLKPWFPFFPPENAYENFEQSSQVQSNPVQGTFAQETGLVVDAQTPGSSQDGAQSLPPAQVSSQEQSSSTYFSQEKKYELNLSYETKGYFEVHDHLYINMFNTWRWYWKHYYNEGVFTCRRCRAVYDRKFKLEDHLKSKHPKHLKNYGRFR